MWTALPAVAPSPAELGQTPTCPPGPCAGGCCVVPGLSGAPAASAHSASLSPAARWTVKKIGQVDGNGRGGLSVGVESLGLRREVES